MLREAEKYVGKAILKLNIIITLFYFNVEVILISTQIWSLLITLPVKTQFEAQAINWTHVLED